MPPPASQRHETVNVAGLSISSRSFSQIRMAAGVLIVLLVLAADRTHTLQLGADATVADVKSVVEARQGEQRSSASSWPSWWRLAALVILPAALRVLVGLL